MRNRTAKASREEAPEDVGTLWTMVRQARTSRCALMAWPRAWELRVVAGGDTLLSARCDRPGEAFVLAEQWKQRMLEQGWRQILPFNFPRTGA